MEDATGGGVPISRHSGRLAGQGVIGKKELIPSHKDIEKAHLVVLKHMSCLAPYVMEHMTMLKSKNPGRNDAWYMTTQNKELSEWMKVRVTEADVDDELVKRLGSGPYCAVQSYQGYDINGYTYYTIDQDKKSAVQNSGVTIVASSGNTMTTIAKESFYGVIQEIWELEYYVDVVVPVFRCKWVCNNKGVQIDNYGFTLVDLRTDGYKSEPFVMARHVSQVFFVKDPSKPRYHIVLQGKRRILGVDNVSNEEEYDQFDEIPPFSVGVEELDNTERPTKIRRDDIDGEFAD